MESESISTAVLRTLHRLHLQLTDLDARLNRGPKRIAAGKANIEIQDAKLASVEDKMKAMRMACDDKQVTLKGGEGKILELKGKLNTASSNREYQAFKDQIAATEMTNSVLEDEILEAFGKIDEFKATVEKVKAAAETAHKQAERIAKEVEDEKPLIEGDIKRLREELQQAEESLPVDVRESYQRVVKAKGEDALAPMNGSFCSGCNRRVLLNMMADLRLSKPVFCKSCGRLLYLAEEDEQ